MSFSRPIQLYHSLADPIWPDGTFKIFTGTVSGIKCGRKLAIFVPYCNAFSTKKLFCYFLFMKSIGYEVNRSFSADVVRVAYGPPED
jgi:hypothetical protein